MQVQAKRPFLCLFCAFAFKPRAYPTISQSQRSHNVARRQEFHQSSHVLRKPYSGSKRIKPNHDHESEWDHDVEWPSEGVVGQPNSPVLRPSAFAASVANRQMRRRGISRPVSLSPRAFKQLLSQHLDLLRIELDNPDLLKSLDLDERSFEKAWSHYAGYMNSLDAGKRSDLIELRALHDVLKDKGRPGLQRRLKYGFYGHALGARFTKAELEKQKELADLRYPAEWFPATRQTKRTVHLHVGPTNSGKTYHALKRLERAKTGMYLGPLRLLAHEVYSRLNATGRRCALVTGEEMRLPEDPELYSCTVEMAPYNSQLEVAVIDEIQMLNDERRGWAWTQALLGVKAAELHLCGEERAVPMIRELCALTGDEVVVHKYERLSPLKVTSASLRGSLNRLEKGDCIVSFSVMGIHSLRKQIETKTGKKAAMIYGALPPETRAYQAKLFNDPNNDYDYLVASDAIGMGLNLSIKRIIFESSTKNNGDRIVPLKVWEIKQIAGRAGRYRTADQAVKQDSTRQAELQTAAHQEDSESKLDDSIALDDSVPIPDAHEAQASDTTELMAVKDSEHSPAQSEAETLQPSGYKARAPFDPKNVGWVTALHNFDHKPIMEAMVTEAPPIQQAGIFPPAVIIERFASYFPPGAPFSYVLLRLHEIARTQSRFFLCNLKDQILIADAIQPVKGLTTVDRLIFCAAPFDVRTEQRVELLRFMAQSVSDNKSAGLLDIPNIDLELLDEEPRAERKYLHKLEDLHKGLVLYLWLSLRFSGVFTTRSLVYHTKQLLEDQIEKTMDKFSTSDRSMDRKAKRRERQMKEQLEEEARLKGQPDELEDLFNTLLEQRKGDASEDAEMAATTPGFEHARDEVKDIITDTEPFREDEAQRDDYDEYPDPELDEEEPEVRRPLSPSSVGSGENVDELDMSKDMEPLEGQIEHVAEKKPTPTNPSPSEQLRHPMKNMPSSL